MNLQVLTVLNRDCNRGGTITTIQDCWYKWDHPNPKLLFVCNTPQKDEKDDNPYAAPNIRNMFIFWGVALKQQVVKAPSTLNPKP